MTALADRHLVIISGGLDSVTLAYKLVHEEKQVAGIYFDIGYRPRVAERNSARLAAHRLGIPLEVVNLQGIFDMVTGFYATESVGAGELDKGQPGALMAAARDPGYVVGIHVLLSTAIYYAQLAGIKNVSTGLIGEQYEFNEGLGAFSDQFAQAIQPLNPDRSIAVENPFRTMQKRDVVRVGSMLAVPFADTWSCLDGQPVHCGHCNGCLSRKEGFLGADIADPTKYAG